MTHRPRPSDRPDGAPARRVAVLTRLTVALACIAGLGAAYHGRAPAIADDQSGFTNFETEPVRPIALGPDGRRLYALNTAEDHLEIFDVAGPAVTRLGEVAVGLRPVALAVRSDAEVWVSNHLSDSVSVVDTTDPTAPAWSGRTMSATSRATSWWPAPPAIASTWRQPGARTSTCPEPGEPTCGSSTPRAPMPRRPS